MNYGQYETLKRKFRVRSKLLRAGHFLLDIVMILQVIFFILKKNMPLDWFNVISIDQFLSNAYKYTKNGNIVLAVMFYGAIFCVIACTLFATFGVMKNYRWGYIFAFSLYIFDFVIAFFAKNTIQLIVHVLILLIFYLGSRNLKELENLPNNIWGIN